MQALKKKVKPLIRIKRTITRPSPQPNSYNTSSAFSCNSSRAVLTTGCMDGLNGAKFSPIREVLVEVTDAALFEMESSHAAMIYSMLGY